MANKANKIKCIIVFVSLVCCAGSTFAAAEADPKHRNVADEYLKEGPVHIQGLRDIFAGYAAPQPKFRDVSQNLAWRWDPRDSFWFQIEGKEKSYHVKPDLDDTFETFKEKIAVEVDVPVEDINLEFEGKQITNIQDFTGYIENDYLADKDFVAYIPIIIKTHKKSTD
jgi:hypothetical protein